MDVEEYVKTIRAIEIIEWELYKPWQEEVDIELREYNRFTPRQPGFQLWSCPRCEYPIFTEPCGFCGFFPRQGDQAPYVRWSIPFDYAKRRVNEGGGGYAMWYAHYYRKYAVYSLYESYKNMIYSLTYKFSFLDHPSLEDIYTTVVWKGVEFRD